MNLSNAIEHEALCLGQGKTKMPADNLAPWRPEIKAFKIVYDFCHHETSLT